MTIVKPKAKRPPRKPVVRSEIKTQSSMVDKAIDLIKWVDSPFKLLEVVILVTLFGLGYFAWDSRQVILNAIMSHEQLPQLKERDAMIPVAETLQKDLDAVTVVVHKVHLDSNAVNRAFNDSIIACCSCMALISIGTNTLYFTDFVFVPVSTRSVVSLPSSSVVVTSS